MMASVSEVLSACLVLMAVVKEAWSCTCFPTHIQQHYCNAQIIFVAKIKGVEEIYDNRLVKAPNPMMPEDPYARMPVERRYKVRIRRFFKGRELLNGRGKSLKYIHTPGTDAACALYLDVGKTYILSGHIRRRREFWTNMCSWAQNYKTINRHQMKGIKFHYGRNCKCTVSWCGHFCKRMGPRECEWAPMMRKDCLQEHGFCMMQSNGQCNWKKNRQLKQCLSRNRQTLPNKSDRPPEIPRDEPQRPGSRPEWYNPPRREYYAPDGFIEP